MDELLFLVSQNLIALRHTAKSFNALDAREQIRIFNVIRFQIKTALLGNVLPEPAPLPRVLRHLDRKIGSILFEDVTTGDIEK